LFLIFRHYAASFIFATLIAALRFIFFHYSAFDVSPCCFCRYA